MCAGCSAHSFLMAPPSHLHGESITPSTARPPSHLENPSRQLHASPANAIQGNSRLQVEAMPPPGEIFTSARTVRSRWAGGGEGGLQKARSTSLCASPYIRVGRAWAHARSTRTSLLHAAPNDSLSNNRKITVLLDSGRVPDRQPL